MTDKRLIERDDLLEDLTKAFSLSQAQEGTTVVIDGFSGSGKTAFLNEFSQVVEAKGGIVLDAAASKLERTHTLSVVSQLLHAGRLPGEQAERVSRLITDGVRGGVGNTPRIHQACAVTSHVLHGLYREIHGISATRPVLVIVDDVHFADDASMQFLLHLARRTKRTRILLVISRCSGYSQVLFDDEILRVGRTLRVSLDPLSESGVARLLVDELGPGAAYLAGSCHRATGGNPLLVKAAAQDYATASDLRQAVLGEEFQRAILSFLHRCAPTAVDIAQALATIDDPASFQTMRKLLSVSHESIAQAIGVLTAAGILSEGRFRHELTRTAIIAGMSAERKREMHQQASRLQFDAGAPASSIARHLVVAAEPQQTAWSISILEEAAHQALAAGDPEQAVAQLRLAARMCAEPGRRASLTAVLSAVEWRLKPTSAARLLPELVSAARHGDLDHRYLPPLVSQLIWHGKVGEAVDVLQLGAAAGRNTGDRADGTPAPARDWWLAYCYSWLSPSRPAKQFPAVIDWILVPEASAMAALNAVLTGGDVGDLLMQAEELLRGAQLTVANLGPITATLVALTYGGHLDTAAEWCDNVLDDQSVHRAPTWHAIFTCVRALIHLRRGALDCAEQAARTALKLISVDDWGVAAGLPVSILVLAAIGRGRTAEVAEHLDIPMPEAMFHTPFGLQYLHARGRFLLAVDRPYGALAAFQTCGRLMTALDMTGPAVVAWHADLAAAYLHLGRVDDAEAELAEQLEQRGAGSLRARGIALRLLAATRPPGDRPELLNEAVAALTASGDQAELAGALADLGRVHAVLGQVDQARIIGARARHLAGQSGSTLDPGPFPYSSGGQFPPGTGELFLPGYAMAAPGGPVQLRTTGPMAADPLSKLSDAERRVAELAGQGHTNTQIACALFITVSTVEQHLTRVYRKLRVSRADLPGKLDPARFA